MNNQNIKSIVLGHCNSFFIENDGSLFGCGYNKEGQLGLGNEENQPIFQYVSDKVTKVAASYFFTIIQKDDGSLYYTGNDRDMGFSTSEFKKNRIRKHNRL